MHVTHAGQTQKFLAAAEDTLVSRMPSSCSLRSVRLALSPSCAHLPSDKEDMSPSEPSRLLCPVPSVPFALCTFGGYINRCRLHTLLAQSVCKIFNIVICA